MRRPLAAWLVSGAVLFASADARAESADDDEARYEWMLAELTRSQAPSRTWWRVWAGGYAALAAGQGTFAWITEDEGLRASATVGAVKSALGLLVLLIRPPTAGWAATSLREMDGSTPDAKRRRRLRAEELLHRSAREQNFGTSWVPHLAAAVTNLTGSFILFHYYDQPVQGWVSLGTGTAVAELQILTHPTGSMAAWNRYVDAGGTVPRAASAPTPAWSFTPWWGGFVLRGSF